MILTPGVGAGAGGPALAGAALGFGLIDKIGAKDRAINAQRTAAFNNVMHGIRTGTYQPSDFSDEYLSFAFNGNMDQAHQFVQQAVAEHAALLDPNPIYDSFRKAEQKMLDIMQAGNYGPALFNPLPKPGTQTTSPVTGTGTGITTGTNLTGPNTGTGGKSTGFDLGSIISGASGADYPGLSDFFSNYFTQQDPTSTGTDTTGTGEDDYGLPDIFTDVFGTPDPDPSTGTGTDTPADETGIDQTTPAPDGVDPGTWNETIKILKKTPVSKWGQLGKILNGLKPGNKVIDLLKKIIPSVGAIAGGTLLGKLIGGPSDEQKALWASQKGLIDKSSTTGFSLLDQGLNELNGPADYYRKLSAGDRSAASEALAPELSQIGASYNQAKQNTQLMPRSGGRSMLFNELPFKQAGDVNNLFSTSRRNAVDKSTALGLDTTKTGTGLIGSALTGGTGLMDQLQQSRNAQLYAGSGISAAIAQGLKDIFKK